MTCKSCLLNILLTTCEKKLLELQHTSLLLNTVASYISLYKKLIWLVKRSCFLFSAYFYLVIVFVFYIFITCVFHLLFFYMLFIFLALFVKT